ncbi:MAG: hypothetical protein ACF8R7_17485 [Phycisphaerales bacterium JB039]
MWILTRSGRALHRACAVAAALALCAPAVAQWEPFFDSGGFESLPLGPTPAWPDTYIEYLPHRVYGDGSDRVKVILPEVTSQPEPTIGRQSIRFDPVSLGGALTATMKLWYSHQTEDFGPDGYRGLRISFDVYHAFDPRPGTVLWFFGGISASGSEPYVQVIWGLSPSIEPRFDEWVHVSITIDFEHKLIWGAYDGEASDPAPLPAKWHDVGSWAFSVVTDGGGDPPPPEPDIETAWIDNLVIDVIPPCPADCDIDYRHTLFDFLCFQNYFAAGSVFADCDGDGSLTLFDFLCFQNAFAAGCP